MATNRDGIWIIDPEGKTVFANDRMGEILGVSASELMGQPSFKYVFPMDVDAAQRLFEAKKQGDINAFSFQLRRKDGASVSVNVQGTPMHNAGGEFLGIVGTFSVVKSRKGPGNEETDRTANNKRG